MIRDHRTIPTAQAEVLTALNGNRSLQRAAFAGQPFRVTFDDPEPGRERPAFSEPLVLDMIENRWFTEELTVRNSVASLRAVSHDPTLKLLLEREDGSTLTAVQLQWEYFHLASKYVEHQYGADVDADGMEAAAGSPAHCAMFDLPRTGPERPDPAGLVAAVRDWATPPAAPVPLYLRRPDAKTLAERGLAR